MKRAGTDPLLFQESQVVVWDLRPVLLPSEFHLRYQKKAILICCGECKQISAFDLPELQTMGELWEMPYRRERVRLRMEDIFRYMKTEYDLYVVRTYLDTAIDSLPDIVWSKPLDSIRVKVNETFCAVIGESREDVTEWDHCYIQDVSPDGTENGEASYRKSKQAVVRADHTLQSTEEVKYSRGMRQLRTYRTPIIDRDGVTVLGTVGIRRDVTDLGSMSAKIEILLRSIPHVILLGDEENQIFGINRKFEGYFRAEGESVANRDYKGRIARASTESYTIDDEGYVEAMVSLPEGFGRMLEIHESSIYDIFHNVVRKLCIFRDVTVEHDLERQILRSSSTNFLTGLCDRRCFYKYINNNREGRTVSLPYIDLDSPKAISDSYGYKVGNAVLIHTTRILSESFREGFVARFSGDRLLVVRLEDCLIYQLEQEADHFLEETWNEFQTTGQVLMLSASVGIVRTGDAGMDIDLLLQRNDQASYRAKKGGGNRYYI